MASLPSRRESASEGSLNELLVLFRNPAASSPSLLEGTLPLRYCPGRFASRIPTWRLPVDCHVAEEVGEVGVVRVEHCSGAVLLGFQGGGGVHWVGGLVEALQESD